MNKNIAKWVAVLACALSFGAAHAHRVNVFAFTEGDQVMVESGFAGGGPARQAKIDAVSPDGKVVYEGKTDDQGKLSFVLPKGLTADSLKIVVNAGEGHRNEWELSLEDYRNYLKTIGAGNASPQAPEQKPAEPAPDKSGASAQSPADAAAAARTKTAGTAASEEKVYTREDLARAVEANTQKLEREVIGPLRRQLAQSREKVISFSDVIGGIGWLLGIAGILAWWSSRRSKGK